MSFIDNGVADLWGTELRPGLLQIRRVNPFRKPFGHGRQEIVIAMALALGLPQSGQSHLRVERPA